MRASIIIPTYNSGELLLETLNSIIPELGKDDEVIVVDDGSSDGTEKRIGSFIQDNRFKYFFQSASGGPSVPRNRGISLAKGDYVFLFDSDDIMLPGKIAETISAFQLFPQAGFVFTNFAAVDEGGKTFKHRFLDEYELIQKLHLEEESAAFLIDSATAYSHLARENFIGTSGVAIKSSVLSEVGEFDESLKNGDDKDMWFRITKKYPVVYLDKELHQYRIRQNSISNGGALKRADARIRVLEKQLVNPVDASFAKDIHRQIALNHYSKAYECFSLGEMAASREALVRAMRHECRLKFIRLYLKTLLGSHCVSALRVLKHRSRM